VTQREIYWRMGRVDFTKLPEGWWVTLWACKPPPMDELFTVLAETWRGPIQIIHCIKRIPRRIEP
jgi:hypothetical protein